MTCNCVKDFNVKLADHNTKIVETLGFPRDGSPAFTRPTIQTEKIESRKRVGPAIAVPSYCPFCGEGYAGYGAPPKADELGDLRQGVTPAGHAVFDCLEKQQAEWGDLFDIAAQLKRAAARAKNAIYAADPAKQRQYAIEAAARLIDAINEMDREIAAGHAAEDGDAK